MSVSSAIAAKRRRAGIVTSPMFKSGPSPSPASTPIDPRLASAADPRRNTPMQQQQSTVPAAAPQNLNQQPANTMQQTYVDPKRPMPLQQVITVLDNRILYLEKHLVESSKRDLVEKVALPEAISHSSFTKEAIDEIVAAAIKEHIMEFDHRYEMLANEIVNLKQIVLQLQSYTLDVNKTLLEERAQIDDIMAMGNCIKAAAEAEQLKKTEQLKEIAVQSTSNILERSVAEGEGERFNSADASQRSSHDTVNVSASVTQSEETSSVVSELIPNNDGVEVELQTSQDVAEEANDISIEAEHLDESANKKASKRKGRNKHVIQVGLDENVGDAKRTAVFGLNSEDASKRSSEEQELHDA